MRDYKLVSEKPEAELFADLIRGSRDNRPTEGSAGLMRPEDAPQQERSFMDSFFEYMGMNSDEPDLVARTVANRTPSMTNFIEPEGELLNPWFSLVPITEFLFRDRTEEAIPTMSSMGAAPRMPTPAATAPEMPVVDPISAEGSTQGADIEMVPADGQPAETPSELDLSFSYGEDTQSGSRERLAYQYAVDAGLRGTELQAYMAQVNHESGGFSTLRERGYSYSENYADMPQVWKDRLARDGVNASNATAASIFNSVYANRNGNGDFASGDGNRYRGRGFIQLTGRANYRQIGEDIGIDLEANPELMEDPEIAARASVAWWERNVQPVITDSNTYDYTNVEAVSGIVNRGSPTKQARGLSDRLRLFRSYSQE